MRQRVDTPWTYPDHSLQNPRTSATGIPSCSGYVTPGPSWHEQRKHLTGGWRKHRRGKIFSSWQVSGAALIPSGKLQHDECCAPFGAKQLLGQCGCSPNFHLLLAHSLEPFRVPQVPCASSNILNLRPANRCNQDYDNCNPRRASPRLTDVRQALTKQTT